jgi:hypothetical protein
MDEQVDTGGYAGEIDVLAVDVGRVPIGVAARGALLDAAQTCVAVAAVAEEDRRPGAHAPGVAVMVGQAEAGLAIARDEAEVRDTAKLVALEADVVPVRVGRRLRVPECAGITVGLGTTAVRAYELQRAHHRALADAA